MESHIHKLGPKNFLLASHTWEQILSITFIFHSSSKYFSLSEPSLTWITFSYLWFEKYYIGGNTKENKKRHRIAINNIHLFLNKWHKEIKQNSNIETIKDLKT
jgi:hypothetical protein